MQRSKAGLVDGAALFGGHEDGEVEGEAVGVVELEGLGAGEGGFAGGFESGDDVVEVRQAAVERGGEGFLFGAQGADDVRALAGGSSGKNPPICFSRTGKSSQRKGFFRPRVRPKRDGAAQEAAQDVAAAVVGGQDAVGDGERQRAQVVGDHAHGDGVLAVVGLTPASWATASMSGMNTSVS
jgi:hypothetical protein